MKKLATFAVLTVLLLCVGIAIAATGSGHNFTTSTNLHLLKPIPGVTGGLGVEPSGTSWMELQNRSFDLIDAHNHSPGSGAPVPTSGLNINADLPFNSFNATLLRALRMNSQSATLGGAGDLRAVYSVLGDLYYNNAAGTPIQITSGGGIAGTPGSISGLASPASASYSAGSTTYVFQGSTNTAATGDFGTVILREKVANALGITLQSPTGLAGAYALTMPTALPASDGLLRLGSTGALSAFGTLSGSNLTLPGTLAVAGATTLTGAATLSAPESVSNGVAGVSGTAALTAKNTDGYQAFIVPRASALAYNGIVQAGDIVLTFDQNGVADTGALVIANHSVGTSGLRMTASGMSAVGGFAIGASGTPISASLAATSAATGSPTVVGANSCSSVFTPGSSACLGNCAADYTGVTLAGASVTCHNGSVIACNVTTGSISFPTGTQWSCRGFN